MQTIIKKRNHAMLFILLALLGAVTLFNACKKDDSNNKIELYSYGPMPIARGAELRFIGNMLDQVSAIELPGGITIDAASFTSISSKLITLTVPQNAVEGYVVLKTPQGDITTKTPMGFSEPIAINSFSPAAIKPGSELTITGDYLNLIGEVIFSENFAVESSKFISQSREQIKLIVPPEAQTGKIAVSNGAEDPIIIYSTTDLTVTLPTITRIAPNPVKAGTDISITGTNLDLVISTIFGGDKRVDSSAFISQTATEIILNVPIDAQDGTVKLVMASEVEVESDVLEMIQPSSVNVSPKTLKNGATLTVTGTNLDLFINATFEGGATATPEAGGTETEITFIVPDAALSGNVIFTTTSNTTVDGGAITISKPVITSFSTTNVVANQSITITGNNLDMVSKVLFTGNLEGQIDTQSDVSLTVVVPVNAQNGTVKFIAINGVEVISADAITYTKTLPSGVSYTESVAYLGQILTINGTNLDLIKEIIFFDNAIATGYGNKSATQIQVVVPKSAEKGVHSVKIITQIGEEGELPSIEFKGGVDPVVDPNLVFFDFDASDAGIGWNDLGAIEELPSLSFSGKYYHVNADVDGSWKVYFARNWGKFSAAGIDPATDVVKLDVNFLDPVGADVVLKVRQTDSDGTSFWYVWKVGELFPNGTDGWITVSLPLSGFLDNDGNGPGTITDVSKLGSEYGLTAGWGAGHLNMCIDNVRFEAL